MRKIIPLSAVLFSITTWAVEPAADIQAILSDTGVKGGLCLAIGLDVAGAQALARDSRLVVQMVASDDQTALDWLRALDAGKERLQVSAVSHNVNPLPYARDVANLIVVHGEARCPPAAEINRVLTPGGVAAIIGAPAAFAAEAGKLGLTKVDSTTALIFRKPPLPAAEDWGSMAGGPELGNSLPDSTIAPTMTLRWRAGPRWQARDYHYDALACGSGVLVYRQIAVVPGAVDQFQQVLIARDAYNGCELWRHVGQPVRRPMYGFNIQPLLAVGEGRICVALDGKMTCLDASTGKTLFTPEPDRPARNVRIHRKYLIFGCEALISVHALADGRLIWSKPMNSKTTAGIRDDQIFLPSGKKIVACRLDTGAEAWSFDTATDEHPEIEYRSGTFCTAAAVHYTKGNKEKTFVFGLDQKTGRKLWCAEGDNPKTLYPTFADMESSLGLIAFSDEIWLKFKKKAQPPPGYTAVMTCMDAATGAIKQKNFTMNNDSTHCWSTKGAGDYLLYSRNMFLNRKTMQVTVNGLVRSICGMGHIPAERQLFSLPHNCRCGTLIRGIVAMGATEKEYDFEKQAPVPVLRELGGKYNPQPDTPADWPLFRGTPQRSSSCLAAIGKDLKKKWETQVGGNGLSQAVSAYGMVFLADRERPRVIALDAGTGAVQWTFPTGASVSVPPVLHKGICLFGTVDGWVWAVDAKSGAPLWKLRAAPEENYIGGQDRFESRWPVVGDVLIQNGVGYVSAGRAGTIDGGVQVLAFDPITGKVAWNKACREVVSADLLVGLAAGDSFAMNAKTFNLTTRTLSDRSSEPPGSLNLVLYSIGGLGTYTTLDDYLASTERNQISARREMLGDRRIAGINVAFSDKLSLATVLMPRTNATELLAPAHRLVAADAPKKTKWGLPADGMRVDGMVVTPEMIYWVGGSPSDDPKVEPVLQIWSAADGKTLNALAIADRSIPEGLSIANRKLFIVTRNGKVLGYDGN